MTNLKQSMCDLKAASTEDSQKIVELVKIQSPAFAYFYQCVINAYDSRMISFFHASCWFTVQVLEVKCQTRDVCRKMDDMHGRACVNMLENQTIQL